jgi:phage terminase small subunit
MTNIDRKKRLTAKQIVFCQKVLEGLNLSDAYRASYSAEKMLPATVNRAAKELMDNPKIAARVGELRESVSTIVVKRAAHTLDAAMDEAGQMLEGAKAAGQYSAGVAAAKLRAQLAGHLSEKKEEHKGALTDIDVEILLKMRDELAEEIKRAKEALALEGAQAFTVTQVPAPFRRVIG